MVPEIRCGNLGLLPDAQSRAFNNDAIIEERIGSGHRRDTQTLYQDDKLPGEVARLFMAGAIRFVSDG